MFLKKIKSIAFYSIPFFTFSHIEAFFVLGILNENFSKKYLLNLPLIANIFLFDAIVIITPLLISTFVFRKKFNKPNLFATSYICALLFTLRFSSKIYNKSFLILTVIYIITFLICQHFLKSVMHEDKILGLMAVSIVASWFYFYTQKVYLTQIFYPDLPLTIYFIFDTILAFGVTLSFAGLCKLVTKKIEVYLYVLFCLIAICEWGIFYKLSRNSFNISVPTKKILSTAKPNVILIVLDTFRADNINELITPNIESFKKDCVVYKNCISTSPWTLPSHASIFTGLYPTSHGAHFLESTKHLSTKATFVKVDDDSYPLAQENLTMAEILGYSGYDCYGVVANYGYINHKTGIAQGFQLYDDRRNSPFYYASLEKTLYSFPVISYFSRKISVLLGLDEQKLHHNTKTSRQAEDINKSVENILNKHIKDNKKPFFMFANYMDAHAAYIPRKSYRERFSSMLKTEWLKPHIPAWKEIMKYNRKINKSEKEHITTAYKGEVKYLDKHIGYLLKYLKENDLYKNTLIVLTADHGEFLGEHNLIGHGFGLYKEVIHVPLFIKYPGDVFGSKLENNAQLVDILPTILDVIKIKIPSNVEGESLYNRKRTGKYMVSELYENASYYKFGKRFRGISRAIYKFPYKYIENSNRKDELYDISSGSEESKNLIETKHDISVIMKGVLSKWLENRKPIGSRKRKLNKEELKNLKTLGYLF